MIQRMLRYLGLFLLYLGLTVAALINCIAAEEDEVRALPRVVWVLAIVFLPFLGAIIYLWAGRPIADGATLRDSRGSTGMGGRPWRGAHERTNQEYSGSTGRTVAPDDDPDFLRQIDQQLAKEDTERLRRWEEDLRRREAELRERHEKRDDG